MPDVLKFLPRVLVATAVVSFAAFALRMFIATDGGMYLIQEGQLLLDITFYGVFLGFLFAPLWIGYRLVRRDGAGMPAIGFAVGVILPNWLFAYYMFAPPSGGVSSVMSILSIPILAIVLGVVMAGLGAVLTLMQSVWRR